jgi:hypothetical protein
MSDTIRILKGTSEEASYVRNRLIAFNATHTTNGRCEEVNLCVKDEHGDYYRGVSIAQSAGIGWRLILFG